MVKKTYKVSGMDCASCASLIEMDLEDSGVKAKCSYPRELLEIEYDEKQKKEEDIKHIVQSAGFKLINQRPAAETKYA